MGEYIAVVRILKDVNLALVERDVYLKKEDVITLPLKVGAILSKHGYAEIISIEYYEKEEINHVMGKAGSENMANVEG